MVFFRDEDDSQEEGEGSGPMTRVIPLLPLRDIVVFPHMIVPLFVGRSKSVKALEAVMKDDRQILLASQRDAAEDRALAHLAKADEGQRADEVDASREAGQRKLSLSCPFYVLFFL